MKVGIDNYGLFPLDLSPMETLQWAVKHGAEGVAFSGIKNRTEQPFASGELADLKSYAREQNLYLEWGGGQHLPFHMSTHDSKEIFGMNRIICEEAAILGTPIIRSCSGGLMRWHREGPTTEEYLDAMGKELKRMIPIVQDLGLFWAIETHFEFTSHELVRLFENNGFYPDKNIGICLDTMNLLTMLEDPVQATQRLLPWIVSTHMKDGGLVIYPEGLRSYPAPIGEGWIRLDEIARLLKKEGRVKQLNLEDHNGSFVLPIYDQDFTNEFPDLDHAEFKKLVDMACSSQSCKDRIEKYFFNRDLWPSVCEKRMSQGVHELKIIRDRLDNE